MADSGVSKKRLALAIIDFLNSSVKDGTIPSDEAESMEIATNCIAESFKVDPSNKVARQDAIGSQNLLSIYNVFEKLKGKGAGSAAASSGSGTTPGVSVPEPSAAGPENAKAKEEAEQLKAQGNAAMQKKDYNLAVDSYTRALALQPLNPIYLSNRAAAYSGARQHEDAKNDAELAVAADPKYTKAWSRLGLAKYALGDAKGSLEAYTKGIEAEGNGGSEAMKRGYETAKKKVDEEGGLVDDDDIGGPDAGTRGAGAGGMPDLASLAGMFGGGGGGGGGGMPDFSQMMNNPMMRQMADNLMQNPDALSGLMNNPQLRNLANQFGGGGGAGAGRGAEGAQGGQGGGSPDLSSLMSDPSIQEMARNFMGGMGRGGAGRGAQ